MVLENGDFPCYYIVYIKIEKSMRQGVCQKICISFLTVVLKCRSTKGQGLIHMSMKYLQPQEYCVNMNKIGRHPISKLLVQIVTKTT